MVSFCHSSPTSQGSLSSEMIQEAPIPYEVFTTFLCELQLQHDIVLARSTYKTDLVTKFAFSNDSRIYQYIRNLSGQRNLPTVLRHGSAMATSRAEKAELLNYFFHSVFNVSSGTLQLDTSLCPEGSLSSIHISLSDTFIGLASLDPSKAMGGDGLLS